MCLVNVTKMLARLCQGALRASKSANGIILTEATRNSSKASCIITGISMPGLVSITVRSDREVMALSPVMVRPLF